MSPCTYCHRRSVASTSEGPLCAVCFQDQQHEEAEAMVGSRQPQVCTYPDEPCDCFECRLLTSVEDVA